MQDIDLLSERLGIPWKKDKDISFRDTVPYIGFSWNIHQHRVSLSEEKRGKYFQAIAE